MKKILLNISSLLTAIITISMFIACSSDDNLDSKRSEGSKQQLTFTLTDEDFNADEEVSVTRAGKQSLEVAKDTIDLGNDVFAEATLERDTARDAKPATRAVGMSNGSYTILAYQSGVLKGTLKGTVTSNVFTATSANQSLNLDPGTYTFYCCNDKVNISGNNLTVNRADAGTARIGITTKIITATPAKQKVDFVMKHVGARVRVVLAGYMPFNNNVEAHIVTKDAISGTRTLDATTGTYTNDNSVAANTTLQNDGYQYLNSGYTRGSNGTFNAEQSGYSYILPETNLSSLMVQLSSLKIYKKTLSNVSITPTSLPMPPSLNNTVANGSYILRITLKYRYKILYSDGTVVPFGGNYSGSGKRIGVVINDNNGTPFSGTAMELNNLEMNREYSISQMTTRKNIAPPAKPSDDTQGFHWTWDASSIDYYTGLTAMHNGTVMDDTRNNAIMGDVATISKSYLPSAGEWAEACDKLFFGETIPTNQWAERIYTDCFEAIIGGAPSGWYWTSSQYKDYYDDEIHCAIFVGDKSSSNMDITGICGKVNLGLPSLNWPSSCKVRRFIHF